MIAPTYQHDYIPTHGMKPRYLANAIDWCERAYALHRAMPDDANLDDWACVTGAVDLLQGHRHWAYDRWMWELHQIGDELDARHWSDDPRYWAGGA